MLMSGSAFVFVMAGGTYDTIHVLKYEKGHPNIVYSTATKGKIVLTSSAEAVSITITEEDGKKTSKRFLSDLDDLEIE